MLRVILWNLFLFTLPCVLLIGWLAFAKKIAPSKIALRFWIGACFFGLVLVFISLYSLRLHEAQAPRSEYVSPRLENNKIVPGYFRLKK